jgi:protein required for attachment to host cells
MRLDTGTYVLVLDGEKALLLENAGDAEAPNLRQVAKELNDDPSDPDDSSVDGRAAANKHAAHQSMAEPDFVAHMAERLLREARRGRFEKLVLVAGPEALGQLRPKLHQEVTGRVVGEVHKTLTKHPLPEIERLLLAEG